MQLTRSGCSITRFKASNMKRRGCMCGVDWLFSSVVLLVLLLSCGAVALSLSQPLKQGRIWQKRGIQAFLNHFPFSERERCFIGRKYALIPDPDIEATKSLSPFSLHPIPQVAPIPFTTAECTSFSATTHRLYHTTYFPDIRQDTLKIIFEAPPRRQNGGH